jgi:hypothetical protein
MAIPVHLSSYVPHVGSDFILHLADGTSRPLQLVSAKLCIDNEVQHCFSLVFLSAGDVLPQHIYRLIHAQLGELDLFLVPIQKRKTGIHYEVVFNLLKDEDQ